MWDETAGDIEVIWVREERKYFCKRGWTGFTDLPVRQSVRGPDAANGACAPDDRLRAALAWGLLSIDHREDGTGEIGRGIHQLVCASSFKFVSGTITPEHAKPAHSDRMGAGNIISAIPDQQTVRGRKTMLRQNMGEQFRLVVQLAARH
jgi:hypothetical protein